jgi:hypothetical protein
MNQPRQPPDANGPQGPGRPQQPGEPQYSGQPQYPAPGSWGPSPQGPPGARPSPRGAQQQDPYAPGGYAQDPYAQGGYPQPGYAPVGYPPPPPGLRLGARLGLRSQRRPEPRFGISLGAAGAILALAGVFVWSLGYLIAGLDFNLDLEGNGGFSSSGDSRRFLGAGLSLVLVVAGYAFVIALRRGPLATAGIVAGALAVPMLMLFVSFDLDNVFTGGLPFSVDAVYLVSTLAWLISYFVIPGARGRSFLLGAAATAFAAYVGLKAAGDSFFRATAEAVGTGGPGGIGDTNSIAAVGLVFGLAYYGVAFFLDHRGRRGAAVAMVYAAFVTTVGGVVAAVPTFKQIGTGVLLIMLGAALSWYGGRYGRRFTTWTWTAGLLIGIGLLVQKAAKNSYAGFGITLIVLGVIVAAVAHFLTSATREAPDVVDEAAPQPAAGWR